MKSLLTFGLMTLTSIVSFATPAPATGKANCANQAVYAAVEKNYKTLDVSTSSCGVKLLNAGSNLETYIVCTSDETDPMEYIVTVIPNKYVEGKEPLKCVVDYVNSSNDSSTPSFDSDKGLIKGAQECSVEYGDGTISCK